MNSGKKKIEDYIRQNLKSFCAYSASTSPETLKGKVAVNTEDIIKIDANENPYGCSPKVKKALAEYEKYNVYPDTGQARLRKALADYVGTDPEQIVAANGSNQLIDIIIRLFVSEGDEVINCTPTFDIYRFSTMLAGGKVVNVKRNSSYDVDINAVRQAVTEKTKLIFIANPNNPTGNLMPKEDILSILELGVPTLIDEAYYEFSGETLLDEVKTYPNLMVLRTFSKWAGLAGVRIGYGVFPKEIAVYLQNIKMPYNVSAASEVAVYASLNDLDYLNESIEKIKAEKARLYEKLKDFRWIKPLPSDANFILCKIKGREAKGVKEELKQMGILVRHFNTQELSNYLRFSVGKPEHTDALERALHIIGGG